MLSIFGQFNIYLKLCMIIRFSFDDAITAFNTTRAGKSEDGKGVIKAMISGPGVPVGEL